MAKVGTGAGNSLRNILITGATSGIGRALALAYAAPKVNLSISGRNRERLEDVARLCREKGATLITRVVDVTDRTAMAAWMEDVDECHPLELVIANAGISAVRTDDPGLAEENTREVFAVNLAGVLNTVLPVIPRMQDRGQGHLALMSSLAGFLGLPNAPAYSASKVAVRAFGEALRPRLARDGVGVSVICPGFVRTPLTAANRFPMPLLMEPETAARIIQQGLARNQALIAFPWPLALAVRMLALMPRGVADAILMRQPSKE